MQQFFKGLDAKLIVALIAFVLVLASIWHMVEQDRQVAAGNHQRDVLIAALDEQSSQAAADREAGARDRAADAANQQALLAYTKAIAAQQAAENQWLVNHHFPVPQRFLTVIRPPRIVVRHPRVSHHVKRRHRSATSSTTPTGPGKSGHAPGHHHKHPRHGRRHH